MKHFVWAVLGLAGIASASDHSNLDAGRPVRFTDAYSAAQGAREIQFGLSGSNLNSLSAPFELKYGYASNRDISIGISPVLGRSSTLDSLHIGHFQTLTGETENGPGFGIGLSADVPLDSGNPLGFGVVAAWSQYQGGKTWRHFNVGYDTQGSIVTGILGFSGRDGLDQTIVGEVGINSNQKWIALGARRQMSLDLVLDFGVEHQIGGRDTRLTIGLTKSY
ncbi:MAG TPA: hypothetical protein VK171_12530 [Fimbriimonas sp.]|nr:hypothetical protein [Fimbriimonas sp.]